jgi:hypothetical protein
MPAREPRAGRGPDHGEQPQSLPSVEKLAQAVAEIHRYDGIRGTFRRLRKRERNLDDFFDFFGIADVGFGGRPVFRHDEMRIGSTAKVRLRVLSR